MKWYVFGKEEEKKKKRINEKCQTIHIDPQHNNTLAAISFISSVQNPNVIWRMAHKQKQMKRNGKSKIKYNTTYDILSLLHAWMRSIDTRNEIEKKKKNKIK